MLKVFMPLVSEGYLNWISARTETKLVDNIKDADLIFFVGGADVDPKFYGDTKLRGTYCDTKRDEYEAEVYKEALKLKKPMIGVCRGAQFLTAMQPGGFLIQDVTNHTMPHNITFRDDEDGEEYPISSTHHQMMYIYSIPGAELIAYASQRLSNHYDIGELMDRRRLAFPREAEIVFYDKSRCFCIQGHPEMMNVKSPTVEKIYEVLVDRLNLNV